MISADALGRDRDDGDAMKLRAEILRIAHDDEDAHVVVQTEHAMRFVDLTPEQARGLASAHAPISHGRSWCWIDVAEDGSATLGEDAP